MKRHPWINTYGAVAVFILILLVMNPELRAFLLVTNYIGLDLMIFFIGIQLRFSLPVTPYANQMRTFLCVAGYTILRVTTRMTALLLAPSRVTPGLTTLLYVLSKNMWCPAGQQSFHEI